MSVIGNDPQLTDHNMLLSGREVNEYSSKHGLPSPGKNHTGLETFGCEANGLANLIWSVPFEERKSILD